MLFCVTILFFVAIWKAEGIPVDSNEKEVSVQVCSQWMCRCVVCKKFQPEEFSIGTISFKFKEKNEYHSPF